LKFHLGFPSLSISDVPMGRWAEVGHLAEDLEFDCLWHSNERFFREMFVRMTVTATATKRIAVGGAIAEPFAIHPAITAQSIATVHELSGGRAMLALGAGGSGFPMMGIERRRPARALREAYTLISALVAGETVSLDGEVVKAHRAHLHFLPPQPLPLWVATRGDLTLGVAGAVADGVLIASHAKTESIRSALALVREGAQLEERRRPIRVMTRVDTCVHADRELAYAGSRLMVARLLWSSYPDRNFVSRVGLSVPAEVEEVIALRDYDAMHGVEAEIPDEFVDAFCWAGTPAEVANTVASVVQETGISEVGFWVLRAPGQSPSEATRLVGEEVIPAVRAAVGRTLAPSS
jgi:5,10-methylenetetrahydromethanopterin reductase